ncbi:MAG: DNA polymerase III subunit beta, partial [Candidatus Promineifilaceae bacterium]
MKLTVLQENLARGLNIVSRAVSTRSTLPVLANVLLATDGGRLKLATTNLEIAITCWTGAKVERGGSITIPHRTLSDLVSTLPPDRVDLVLDEKTNTLHLSCARIEANIKGIDADEFPLVPEPGQEERYRIETAVLKGMINQVAFAAANDDARPTLTGVLTRLRGKELTMAATDGYRLSLKTSPFTGSAEPPIEVVIPARALAELGRVADDASEHIHITLPRGRNQIIFELDDVVLVSQLIDGHFPDFQPVIPQRFSTRTVLNTSEFAKACKMAEIFARDASYT